MSSAPVRSKSPASRSPRPSVPGEAGNGTRGPLIAVAMARAIIAVVFVDFCLIALLFVISTGHSSGEIALAVGYLLVLLALQLFYFSRADVTYRSPLFYVALTVQAALAYLPMLQFSDSWIALPSLLAGTMLLVLPAWVSWPAFALIVAVDGWIEGSVTGSALEAAYIVVVQIVAGLEVYGLTRLAQRIIELHEARTELAKAAVAHERLRFARDLHDLLGLSLSEIAPKGELAARLVSSGPARARRELSEISDIARRALADVRSVARGYRELNLDEASRTAESVLAASAVDVRMELNHGELPVPIRTLLATVLREGVTNVLLHSRAERCEIILRQAGDRVSLDIVNDGINEEDAAEASGGGIAKLRESVAEVGGELTAGLDPDGRFRLHLSAPVSGAEVVAHDEGEPAEQVPRSATRLAQAVASIVFCGLFVQQTLRMGMLTKDVAEVVVRVACMSVLVGSQLFYFSRPGVRLRAPASYAMLLGQAVAVYLPLALFDTAFLGLSGFLAGSALLVLPPAAGWLVFTAVMASGAWVQVAADATFLFVAFNVGGALISGLVVYGLTWMVRSVAGLRAARIELAQAAVAQERLRFARDLHDLLGLSLSAIALKSELAHRLVTADPERARDQVSEILSIARLALADVPSVASGSRELSLEEEFQSAESLLSAVDIDVRLDLDYGELPNRVGTVLATVLREGVTNVLRHSKGEWCEISVRSRNDLVVLDIVNDGVAQGPPVSRTGSGIHNLSARLATIGGELHAGIEPEGRYRLQARVPV